MFHIPPGFEALVCCVPCIIASSFLGETRSLPVLDSFSLFFLIRNETVDMQLRSLHRKCKSPFSLSWLPRSSNRMVR